MNPPRPVVQVAYSGQDFTALLDSVLTQFTWIDALGGEADEVELQLEDAEGLLRSGTYWARKGDELTCAIGYEGEPMYRCGTFVLDEVQVDGPPWLVRIKALTSSAKLPLRQANSRGFEGQTFLEIAESIARAHRLKVKAEGLPDLVFGRVTQRAESDLAFLDRLCAQYGVAMKLQPGVLILQGLNRLLDLDALLVIRPGDVLGCSLRSKATAVPRSSVIRSFDPMTGEKLAHLAKPRRLVTTGAKPAPGARSAPVREVLPSDRGGEQSVLKILTRVEDQAQADHRAALALLRAQLGTVEGTLTLPGDGRLRAGANVYLEDFGEALDGAYFLNRARHRVNREGWEVEVDLGSNPRTPRKPHPTKPSAPLKKLTGSGR